MDLGTSLLTGTISALLLGSITPAPVKTPLPHFFRCGVVSVTGVASTGTVTFVPPEWGASYTVLFTCTADAGTPPAAARRARLVLATADKFDFALDSQPGTGNTVTFDWILFHPFDLTT